MRNDIKYWLGLSKIQGVGAMRFKKLISYFDSMQSAWQADFGQLKRTGLEESVIRNIIEERKNINLDEEMETLERQKINLVTILDDEYPKLLKEIYSPPALLYYKGNLEDEGDEFAVAAVGTRKFSSYGKQVTQDIISQLVRQGITTVSGLALGIDSMVHDVTLRQAGRTISVLGSGLDEQNIYPSSNRYLAQKILENNGLLISEYPIGTLPLQGHFPQRNRIIAGLTVATLVIEAPEESGALITARYALEFNRDVLAIPGNIYNQNALGTNNLIKLGAKLVTSAADVAEVLNMKEVKEFVQTKKILPDSNEEKIILEILSTEPIHINQLIKESGLLTSVVNSTLILMEMKGKVKNLGNQMYVTAR
jgi:DNA processing protein